MKTQNNNPTPKGNEQPTKQNSGNNPKLPNNDPDQTPEKETPNPPVANPNKNGQSTEKKIGFKK